MILVIFVVRALF